MTAITWKTDQPNIYAKVEDDQRAHLGNGVILFVRFDAIGRKWYSYSNRPTIRGGRGYETREAAKAAVEAAATR